MRNRSPRFFWQALWIVLPMIVLAGAGFYSLRLDQALAEREAKERARSIANEIARIVWTELTFFRGNNSLESLEFAKNQTHWDQETGQAGSPPHRFLASTDRSLTNLPSVTTALRKTIHFFTTDESGNLLFPKPYLKTILPKPRDFASLNQEQVRLWQAAQTAEYQEQDLAQAIGIWREFLATQPPKDFAAPAHYALALLLERQGQPAAALEAFQRLGQQYPDAVGESGLPLKPFADLHQLQLLALASGQGVMSVTNDIPLPSAPDTNSTRTNEAILNVLVALYSAALDQPNPLSPYLLTTARQSVHPFIHSNVAAWESTWQRHELARRLHAAACPSLTNRIWFRNHPEPQTIPREVQSDSPGARNLYFYAASKNEVPQQLIWFHFDEAWLATASLNAGRWHFWCSPAVEIQAALPELLRHTVMVPEYFGVRIRIDRKVLWANVLANLDDLLPDPLARDGYEQVQAEIFLTHPKALYAHLHTRLWIFGSLISLAALAAVTGLIAAWRAFQRQVRLGEMKSNFVSSVSHELRAPIASVRLMAESLEHGRVQTEEKKTEYFRFMVQECRRLSSLIENVLDFSRIEQGRKQYELEPTDLIALVQQTVKVMEPYAVERQVTLTTAINQRQPSKPDLQIHCDARALQQALVNLIDNAIKHSPPRSTITIGVEGAWGNGVMEYGSDGKDADDDKPGATALPSPQRSDPPPPHSAFRTPHSALLWVEDRGEGIPPEEQERIFERFYRCGSELRRETQGVGIGLSIVKHIVEAHGGRIHVRSAPGQGARFTIELPQNEPQKHSAAEPQPRSMLNG